MSFRFGAASKQHLLQVDPDLRAVAELALSWGIMDFTVYESIRTKAEQNRLYNCDPPKTDKQWPNSGHNILNPGDLSQAFDAAPYINGAISWDTRHCLFLAGIICSAAAVLRMPLRWGGNWDMDGEPVTDQTFDDLVHYEKRRVA